MTNTFINAYIEAAEFADWPEDGAGASWAPDALTRMTKAAESFYAAHASAIEDYPEGVEQAGHDLWFTRNGHGVGYWENDGPAAEELDAAARALPTVDLYVGDNGQVHVS